MSKRIVHHAEALAWLANQPDFQGSSFVTSLPDRSEIPALSLAEWRSWFIGAAAAVLDACVPEGVAIFYQTDVKREGGWIDKAQLCHQAAEQSGVRLVWHKIVCRKPPGTVTHGRAGYAHLLCFSRQHQLNLAKASPDVLLSTGKVLWARGMSFDICLWACRYVLEQTPSHTVIDPFCGKGTVLAAANEVGLDAVGVELSWRRAQQARQLRG